MIYNSNAEILFPLRLLPEVKVVRGESWTQLIDLISAANSQTIDRLAMELLLVRLAGCMNCDSDSFRAMKGCEFCIRQVLRRFKGTDAELIRSFEQSKKEMNKFMKERGVALPS